MATQQKKNKMLVVVPYFGRTEITKLCFERLENQSKKIGFDVVVAGDDPSIVPDSFKQIEVDNKPLSNKLNALVSQGRGYDLVSVMGSDNFCSDTVWKEWLKKDPEALEFYGLDDIHIYSVWHNKLSTQFPYTERGDTIGVARCWTKATLRKMKYKLWSDDKPNGLDSDSKRRMLSKGIKEVAVAYGKKFLLDVKQDNNITDPKIVETGKNDHDVNIIKSKLRDVGSRILDLKPGKVQKIERIKPKPAQKKPSKLLEVVILVDDYGLKVGQKKRLKANLAKEMVRKGFAKWQ